MKRDCLLRAANVIFGRLKPQKPAIDALTDRLCLSCALCCNGVIFRDVKLRAADDAKVLKAAGLPIKGGGKGKFPQPCVALDGCRCRVYEKRPTYCRQFECALFKNALSGKVKTTEALRVIRMTLKRVAKVNQLLLNLGDIDGHLPLAARFHATAKRIATSAEDKVAAQLYGELTLAMHELNLLLSEKFYPDQG